MTRRGQRTYEGDWFAVPLAAGGYGVGLVARAPSHGDTLFGYFFGPVRSEMPSLAHVDAHSAGDAVMVARFSDHALASGRWPVVGSFGHWERRAWPMPAFRMPKGHWLTGKSFALQYLEDNPGRFLGLRAISKAEEAGYPPDEGVFVPSHVERRLDVMLRG